MTIDIKPMSKGSASDKEFGVPDPLPQTSFFINIVGERASGKTCLIQNLISIYKSKMDYIVICSPSVKRNDDFDFIKEDGKSMYKFDDVKEFGDIIREMIKSQDDILKSTSRSETPNVLLVLDDILETNVAAHRNIVEVLALNGRHIKISVLLAGQVFKAVSNKIRANADMTILFSCTNLAEMSKFVEEFMPKKVRKDMEQAMLEVFNEPYVFITIVGKQTANRLKLKRNERIMYKFEHSLI
jgi:hypothetical protein